MKQKTDNDPPSKLLDRSHDRYVLLSWELRKLISVPMIWIFIALCLSLNSVLLLSDQIDTGMVRYISQSTGEIGQRMGSAFDRSLAALPSSPSQAVYQDALVEQTKGAVDPLKTYDLNRLSGYYTAVLNLPDEYAERMNEKYEALAPIVRDLSESGASMDVYAGALTPDQHIRLFGVTLRLVLTEAILLSVLLMLYTLGCEVQNGTDLLIYATKTGRRVTCAKLLSGLLAGIGGFLLLCAPTLLLYFHIWDYSGLWQANVSSQFNYVTDLLMTKPFLTWRSFTVAQYLIAVLLLCALLTALFSLLSGVIGILVRNTYLAFLTFLLSAAGMMSLPYIFSDLGWMGGYFISMLLPVPVWYVQSLWLTDLGSATIIPWHETKAILAGLCCSSLLLASAFYYFKGKDLN